MSAARDLYALGPATEALIANAFAAGALITPEKAAEIIGLSERTLRDMAKGGVIRSVIIGASTRRYTEADIRAYLAGERFGEVQPCPSTSRRRAASGGSTSNSGVSDIRDLLEQRRAQRRSGLRRPNA